MDECEPNDVEAVLDMPSEIDDRSLSSEFSSRWRSRSVRLGGMGEAPFMLAMARQATWMQRGGGLFESSGEENRVGDRSGK